MLYFNLGCGHRKPLLVSGGRKFVLPFLQQVQGYVVGTLQNVYTHNQLSLKSITLQVKSQNAHTYFGVPLSITGTAQVKIQGQDKETLLKTCEQLLGKSERAIEEIALGTLEGHQQAVMGKMTVEEIVENTTRFSQRVYEATNVDLINMGISLTSYHLQDIRDDNRYLESLNVSKRTRITRDVRITSVETQLDAITQLAAAAEKYLTKQCADNLEISKAKRNFELSKAIFAAEVNEKRAEADLAYQFEIEKLKQTIMKQRMQTKLEEKQKEVLLQNIEILRKDAELTATIRLPAVAEKDSLERLAIAHRDMILTQAEAESASIRLKAEAEASAIEAKAKAEAQNIIRKLGEYELYKNTIIKGLLHDATPNLIIIIKVKHEKILPSFAKENHRYFIFGLIIVLCACVFLYFVK